MPFIFFIFEFGNDQEISTFGCFCHSLNLCIKNSLEAFKEEILIIRTFIKVYKKKYKIKNVLEELNEGNKVSFILDCKTRWASTYRMIKSYLDHRKVIERFEEKYCEDEHFVKELNLNNEPGIFQLTKRDYSELENIVKFLKPIVDVISILEGDTYPTISMIVFLVEFLKDKVKKSIASLEITPNYSSRIHKLFKTMQSEIKRRFSNIPIIITISALLSPSTKNLNILDKDRDTILEIFKEEIEEESSNEEEEISRNSDELHDFLNRKNKESDSPLEDEWNKYIKEGIDLKKDKNSNLVNVLNWWRKKEYIYPKLSKLAKKYLCIPASSAPSERLFSVARKIIREDRTNLTSENIGTLAFLYNNYKYFQ